MNCNCETGGQHDNYKCDKETVEEFTNRVSKAVVDDIGIQVKPLT